jgi:ATP-dependent RNA/DNA helicase IGHMBP2
MSLSSMAADRVGQLEDALDGEMAEAKRRRDLLLADADHKSLEARGVFLRRAVVSEVRFAGGRARLHIGEDTNRRGHLSKLRVRPGGVMQLMPHDEGTEKLAVVLRRDASSLVLDWLGDADDVDELPETIDALVLEDVVTLRRLKKGLGAVHDCKGRGLRLVEVAVGARAPTATRRPAVSPRFFDEALNHDQREAVIHGVYAPDVGCIHGPPGTGKTRVVVEVIRQCVAQGERVLALTSSHAAVDHLADVLLASANATSLTRLGEPARIHPAVVARSLRRLVQNHPHASHAKALFDDARKLERDAHHRRDTAFEARQRLREARHQARALRAQARELERVAEDDILRGTKVLCGTLTTGLSLLAEHEFQVLVVDEASQALTPAILLALPHVQRVVLAGDHRQLPPVVLSAQAQRAGLGHTMFDVLAEQEAWATMAHQLTEQHRMHAALMTFPSQRFYRGTLRAHADVAERALNPALSWPFADGALDVVDTAGAGFAESADGTPDSGSLKNTEEADVVARLVRAAIEQGVAPNTIGIIAPYAAQASLLRQALAAEIDAGVEVDTVDGFQGREKAVMLVSCVRSNDDASVGFLTDVRRLNVAMTRAQCKLVVVGDSATLGADPTWSAFFDHAIATGAHRSVFELMNL